MCDWHCREVCAACELGLPGVDAAATHTSPTVAAPSRCRPLEWDPVLPQKCVASSAQLACSHTETNNACLPTFECSENYHYAAAKGSSPLGGLGFKRTQCAELLICPQRNAAPTAVPLPATNATPTAMDNRPAARNVSGFWSCEDAWCL